jgi:hypothetical protein
MAAYPTVSAPYGLKPVNLIGGQVFAGSTRNFPIQYNYATAIYYGDSVTTTAGYATIPTYPVNSTNTTVGVFMGCYYTNPTTKQRLFSQYYPGNVTAGDITAIVCDDPDTVFKVAVTAAAGSSTIASASSILLGGNMVGGTLTGSAATGNGAGAVVATSTTAASTAGFRVLRLVPDTQTSVGGTYVSGTGGTSLVVSGLSVGTVLPIGTDVFNVVNGQLQFTGSTLTAASTVTTTGSTTLTVTASTVTVAGTVALVQTPEVLVKVNFGVHRYNLAAGV